MTCLMTRISYFLFGLAQNPPAKEKPKWRFGKFDRMRETVNRAFDNISNDSKCLLFVRFGSEPTYKWEAKMAFWPNFAECENGKSCILMTYLITWNACFLLGWAQNLPANEKPKRRFGKFRRMRKTVNCVFEMCISEFFPKIVSVNYSSKTLALKTCSFPSVGREMKNM